METTALLSIFAFYGIDTMVTPGASMTTDEEELRLRWRRGTSQTTDCSRCADYTNGSGEWNVFPLNLRRTSVKRKHWYAESLPLKSVRGLIGILCADSIQHYRDRSRVFIGLVYASPASLYSFATPSGIHQELRSAVETKLHFQVHRIGVKTL